jgi:hypothetical protein
MRTNEEVAEMLLERLAELSPAVTVEDGEEPWQVRVTMSIARNGENDSIEDILERRA